MYNWPGDLPGKTKGPFSAPTAEQSTAGEPFKSHHNMKRRITILVAMIVLMLAGSKPAAAQNRYIVRTGGLTSVLHLCLSAGCQVQGSFNGPARQTYLVTSSPVYSPAFNGSVGIASTMDWDTRSSLSNYGTTAAWIAAPGESVTYPGGTYASASSTSFSSPLVAGTASLLISAKPPLIQKQAASALSHAVQFTPDLNHGRLDVYQTISVWLIRSGSNSGSGFLFSW